MQRKYEIPHLLLFHFHFTELEDWMQKTEVARIFTLSDLKKVYLLTLFQMARLPSG